MPFQQPPAQINIFSSTPTPSPQRSCRVPHLRCYNPTATPTRFHPSKTKCLHFNIHPERRYSRKVHPKTANSLHLRNPKERLSLTASRKHTYRPSIEGGISVLKKLSKIPPPIPLSEIPDLRVTIEQPLSDPFTALMAAVNYANSSERPFQVSPTVLVPASPNIPTRSDSSNKRKGDESPMKPPSSKRQKGKTVTSARVKRSPRLHRSTYGVQTRSMTKKRVEGTV